MNDSSVKLVEDCIGLVADAVGLWFSADRLPEFARGLSGTCQALGLSQEELWSRLRTGDELAMMSLTENLTIGETYFYRDANFFEMLEQKFVQREFPAESVRQKRLKIWSAGCSTGEEPYSIAIALRRCLLGLEQWDVSVLATDLNNRSLAKAEEGSYGKWSFRNTPEWLQDRYFNTTEDQRKMVLPMVRDLVSFRQLNLAKGHFPSAFNGTKDLDLVVCRNCLMYLEPHAAASAVERFVEALRPGGFLVLSPVDGGLVADLGLQAQEAGFYQKPGQTSVTPTFQVETPVVESVEREALADEQSATLSRARRLFIGEFWAPAELLLRPLAEKDERDAEVHLLLSYCLAQQGKLEEAKAVLLEQIEQKQLSPKLYRLLGACYFLHGEFKQAEDLLRKALYLQAEDAATHQLQGLVLYDEKPERARKHFAKAAALSTRSLVGMSPLELSGVAL